MFGAVESGLVLKRVWQVCSRDPANSLKSMIVLVKHSHFLERQRWPFPAEIKESIAMGGNSLAALSVCVCSLLVSSQLWTCVLQLQPAIPGLAPASGLLCFQGCAQPG